MQFELADPRKTPEYWAARVAKMLQDAHAGDIQSICFPSIEDVEKFEITFFSDLFHIIIPDDNGPITLVPKYGLDGHLVPIDYGSEQKKE